MEDTKLSELEEMLRGTKSAEEPGEDLNEIIQKGNEDKDKPEIGAMTVTSAGYTIVYDTRTGWPSTINNNNLRSVLRKTREDNSYFFGLKQTVKPVEGTFKCLLHKDDSNREHYDTIGLAVCPKNNLSSPYQVMRHMQKRQKVEWGAIDQERKDAEKKEDRDFQRTLMSKALEEKAPLYVSDKDKKKQGAK